MTYEFQPKLDENTTSAYYNKYNKMLNAIIQIFNEWQVDDRDNPIVISQLKGMIAYGKEVLGTIIYMEILQEMLDFIEEVENNLEND